MLNCFSGAQQGTMLNGSFLLLRLELKNYFLILPFLESKCRFNPLLRHVRKIGYCVVFIKIDGVNAHLIDSENTASMMPFLLKH